MKDELEFLLNLYNQSLGKSDLDNVGPYLSWEMGSYKGQQDIYRDKKRTAPLSQDRNGI